LDKELTVREAVELYAAMYPRRNPIDRIIEIVGLEEKADARVKTLSGGQRRRVDLALGIVGKPELIFLDEPTTGFDPSARRKSWELIDRLRSLGTTILLTTHYMDEAQNLADRVAVLSGGVIVAAGAPDTLGRRSDRGAVVGFTLPEGAPSDLPAPFSGGGPRFEVRVEDPTRDLHARTSWATSRNVSLLNLTVSKPTLEDVYLELTGDNSDG
jgi:ABC-2 type transport system ATP-binding protein